MSGSINISHFADNLANGFVELYCGMRTSGRLVASLQIPANAGDGNYYYPAPSSALSGLTLGGVPVPSFAADTTEYSMTVDNSVERATVAATVAAANATYAVTAPADADVDTDGHQVDLAVGVNPVITVVVTAIDDTTTTYTVTVTRRAPTAMTVVWSNTVHGTRDLTLTWTDGGTCASETNYYGYAKVLYAGITRYFDIGNVASTQQMLSGEINTDLIFGSTSTRTDVLLYCGARASGRLVAEVQLMGQGGTFRTPTPALSALSLTGVSDAALGFEKDTLDYSVTVGNGVASTTVAAEVDAGGRHLRGQPWRRPRRRPGHPPVGRRQRDHGGGERRRRFGLHHLHHHRQAGGSPRLHRRGVAAEATEGDALIFTLRRAGSMDGAVPVKLNVSETGDMVAPTNEGMRTVTIPDGSDIRTFQVADRPFRQGLGAALHGDGDAASRRRLHGDRRPGLRAGQGRRLSGLHGGDEAGTPTR